MNFHYYLRRTPPPPHGMRCLPLLLSGLGAAAAAVTISNVEPRLADDGGIMDAHDGNVVVRPAGALARLPGFERYAGLAPNASVYLWYAAGYGSCAERTGDSGCAGGYTGCGFLSNHSVNLFSSADLATWAPHGDVLPLSARPPWSTIFSPKVAFNAAAGRYVLWVNYLQYDLRNYSYAVAVSATPDGPFAVIDDMAGATTRGGFPKNTDVGDFSLLVDDDPAATAYIAYSSSARVSVERLTPDYTASTWVTTNATSGLLPLGNEAPAFFKRGGWYYVLVSVSCCYCGEGGLVYAYRAAQPLGPYALLSEIARGPNRGRWGGDVCTSSQQTATVSLDGRTDAGATVVWVGDRWQSAPDGLKGHDFTFWEPLSFDAGGNITHMQWVDNFTLPLGAAQQ